MNNFNTTVDKLLIKKESLEESLNEFIARQAEAVINEMLQDELFSFLEDYVDSEKQNAEVNSKNGFYERTIGFQGYTLKLMMPRDRLSKFKTKLLKPYARHLGQSLNDMICNLYLKGLSNAEIEQYLKTEYGDGPNSISAQTISKMTKNLVNLADDFHNRKLPKCIAIYLDATYVPLRRVYKEKADSYEKEAVLVALGITEEGKKQILEYRIVPNEGASMRKEFLLDLKDRDIGEPKYFITDGLCGMPEAIKEIFPEAILQRCLVHVQRNLCSDSRKKDAPEISKDFKEIYEQSTRELAIQKLENFVSKWGATYPSFKKLLLMPGLFEFYNAPDKMRRHLYTTNAIEGFNSKLKREIRKRISLNSFNNAEICISESCMSYNRKARLIRGYREMDFCEKNAFGFKSKIDCI